MTDPKPGFDKLADQPGKPEPARVSVKVLQDTLAALGLVLDQVDYTASPAACGPDEMVGAVLSAEVIRKARDEVANAKRAIAEAEGQGSLGV